MATTNVKHFVRFFTRCGNTRLLKSQFCDTLKVFSYPCQSLEDFFSAQKVIIFRLERE